MSEKDSRCCYFVDEAGDLTLFGKRGQRIIGQEGVSRVFMVGVAHLADPRQAERELGQLRSELLNDPYFAGVPSMQLKAKKTALFFHACKDLPEIRREVFKLLSKFDTKVQVAVRRKDFLAQIAFTNYKSFGRKITDCEIYDDLVKRLFKNLLHKADENLIFIARRGKSARLEAIETAVNRAKKNFETKWGIRNMSIIKIQPAYSHEYAGLQIIDYYLWALQRMYERGEDRFFNLLSPHYRMIMDLDDTRNKRYGEWYTDKNPLTVKKMKPVAG